MIPRLRNTPCEERTGELNSLRLSRWRVRGDLIEVFKTTNLYDNNIAEIILESIAQI